MKPLALVFEIVHEVRGKSSNSFDKLLKDILKPINDMPRTARD